MFGSDSISTFPYIAKRQLWDRLPGKYRFMRDWHHDLLINGQKCTQADIICSWGIAEVTSCASADPLYQTELLQTSDFYIVTKTGDVALMAEARVFRFLNGEWSLWDTDGYGTVTKKITNLELAPDISPSYAELKAVERPWVDGKGENVYLGLKFYPSEEPWWTMHHSIKQGKEVTVQGTWYRKLHKDRQEGWLKWLAEGAKVGFVGMNEYVGP